MDIPPEEILVLPNPWPANPAPYPPEELDDI